MGFFSKLFGNKSEQTEKSVKPVRRRGFEDKLLWILEQEQGYSIRKNIPVDELEEEFGCKIYSRGANYCLPDAISYGVYRNGTRLLYVRFWREYGAYNHMANRQIRKFCEQKGIRILDFFGYLPNEEDYMQQRILEQLQ